MMLMLRCRSTESKLNGLIVSSLKRDASNLDLTTGVTYLGRDQDEDRLPWGLQCRRYDWSFGLEVRMPWGFRDARARARKAKRAVESATLQLYNIKQEKALAARKAWRSASAGFKRIEVTRNSVLLNEEAFEQERARYGSGLVPYRSLLEAQRDYDVRRAITYNQL